MKKPLLHVRIGTVGHMGKSGVPQLSFKALTKLLHLRRRLAIEET